MDVEKPQVKGGLASAIELLGRSGVARESGVVPESVSNWRRRTGYAPSAKCLRIKIACDRVQRDEVTLSGLNPIAFPSELVAQYEAGVRTS